MHNTPVALHLLYQQAVLNPQSWYILNLNRALGGVKAVSVCVCVCVCVVEVPGSVRSAAPGVELSPVCIHGSSDSQHNLKGLQGVRGINCSCNLRP